MTVIVGVDGERSSLGTIEWSASLQLGGGGRDGREDDRLRWIVDIKWWCW